jgi:imidazoleglycerol phosphate dehydratase HisB
MRKGSSKAEFRGCKAEAQLDLDGSGKATIISRCGFLDHMLQAMARTGNLDLIASADPGLFSMQALATAIGQAMDDGLKDRRGIFRYGTFSVPMDEARADVSLDFSGRPYLVFSGVLKNEKIGDFEVQLLLPFLEAMCVAARLTLNIRVSGENDHHMVESIFKALGFAIRQAIKKDGTDIPSTKGVI